MPLVTPTPHPRRPSWLGAGAVALALALAAPVRAQPGDPMLDLLRERGLIAVDAASAAVERAQDGAAELVLTALNFLDVNYRYGGNSATEGFDCSGFTRYVFASVLGLTLPRRADEQAHQAGWLDVTTDELRPGDLVFFNTMRRAFSHVGIYVGDGKFIHSPRSGAQVRIESLRSGYWQRRFDGARRAGGVEIAAHTARP